MTDAFPIDVDTLGDLKPLSQVVFSLGSNLGDSIETLQGAVNRLAETPNLILVDVDILADHLYQLFLQRGQVIRLAALATFVGNDDRQALFGN